MNEYTGVIEMEQRVNARPETVFSYFTDPEKYRLWQGAAAELDPRPGGVYRVDFVGSNGVRGTFVEVDPPRRVVYTWGWERRELASGRAFPPGIAEVEPGSTTVEITLVPDGEGTVVRLRHSGLPTEVAGEAHAWGWTLYLGRLATAASGADPGPDPLPAMMAVPHPQIPWVRS